jgi:hypothetical protein
MNRNRIRGMFRFSARQLLASLILFLLVYPFVEQWPSGDYIASALFSFILFSSVLAVGGRRGIFVVGLLLMLPATVFRWSLHFTSVSEEGPLLLLSMVLAIGFTISQLLRFVLRAGRVDSEILCAGISVYLLMGFFWANIYVLVDDPKIRAFSHSGPDGGSLGFFDALYFSFMTLTTAGYGDIVPLSRPARSMATLEAICGVLYLAVLISRLVSVYTAPKLPGTMEDPGERPREGSG